MKNKKFTRNPTKSVFFYGTQFYEDKGKLIPRTIKNPHKLNTRRKEMGLEPSEVYGKRSRSFSNNVSANQKHLTTVYDRGQ